MNASRLLAILGLVFIGMLSRFLPHPPNFTSLNAIALFGTFYLGSRWLSLATIIFTLLLTDMVLGFHSTMPFVYLSFSLVLLMGYSLYQTTSLGRLSILSLASSTLFFIVTNFGVWATDSLYPNTWLGLKICYLAALPYFAHQVLGDLAYATLLFGFMSLVKASFLKQTTAQA